MDGEAPLGLRVVLIELVPGLEGVHIGGRPLGVDAGVDQIGIARLPGRLEALGEHEGVELGVGGDLRGGQEHLIELVGGEVDAVIQLPVPHGDGEGERLDIQLLPQLGGDVGGGVGGEFDMSHSSAS